MDAARRKRPNPLLPPASPVPERHHLGSSGKGSPYHNQNLNQFRDHFRQQLQSLAALDPAQLIRSVYKKRQDAERKKRKLSAIDQRFMEEAEGLLYRELAAVLGISREEVCGYISKTLKGA